MPKRITLPAKAVNALSLVDPEDAQQRVQRLWDIHEYSLGLLVIWRRAESLLKLIRYYDRIKDGWPDDLNFIIRTWRPLARIYAIDPRKYNEALAGGKCLRAIRNQIVHADLRLDVEAATALRDAGEWLVVQLRSLAPDRESLRRKKRNSDAHK